MRKETSQEAGPQRGPLRVGLIVDGLSVRRCAHEVAVWGMSNPEVRVTHVIVENVEEPASGPREARERWPGDLFPGRALRDRTLALLSSIEKRRLSRNPVNLEHLDTFDLGQLDLDRIEVHPDVSPDGLNCRYRQADLQAIETARLEVLIRFGSGCLQGAILELTKFGVLSIVHGDTRKNRAGPAGFWEAYRREPATGYAIRRDTEDPDGGRVLSRGSILTRGSYLATQARLCRRAVHHLKRVLVDLARWDRLPVPEERVPYCGPVPAPPTLVDHARYFLSLSLRTLVSRLGRRLSPGRLDWSVSVVRADWREAALWQGETIANPPGRYLADPFVIRHQDEVFCFVEDFDISADLGCISAYRLAPEGYEALGPVLVEPFHLSFPYVFRHDGRLLMIPETHQAREIRLYEASDFPFGWKLKTVLMADVDAADTMVFPAEGRWWMLTNIDPTGHGEHASELYVFHADSLETTGWTSHPLNPVVNDPSHGRNGGILCEDGAVFRVAQRQGFEFYGAGSSIRRITALGPDRYAEELVSEIEPVFHKAALGIHHFHGSEGITVFDSVSRVRAGFEFPARIVPRRS